MTAMRTVAFALLLGLAALGFGPVATAGPTCTVTLEVPDADPASVGSWAGRKVQQVDRCV